jgi:hypothetical protein
MFLQAAVTERGIRLLRYELLHPKGDNSPGFRVPPCLCGRATTVEAYPAICHLIDEP